MKTILQQIALFTLLFSADAFAQDVTTVRANNNDISDNLDLQAVASIFGESRDLEDFERRLNDPEIQISNLDLNGDNKVDYLRVVEAAENNTHLIIIQAVLGPDTFQDIATVEVEKDRSNNVQVQVVGDTYMYGSNYIYEPVYVSQPIIYDTFWVSTYRPYYSPWYWNYYPTYYTYWAPYPVYRYRTRVHNHINTRNNYVYVNTRRSSRSETLYNSRRQNAYEKQHPNNSFSSRNKNVSNRYALEQSRGTLRTSRGAGSATKNSFSNSRNADKSNKRETTARAKDNNSFSNSSRNQSARNADSPAKTSNSAVRNSAVQQSKNEYTAPARNTDVQRSAPVQQAAPARIERTAPVQQQAAPVRQSEPVQIQRSAPVQQQAAPIQMERSAPVQQQAAPVRQSAPVQQAAPARQSAPMQSAPAPSRSGGGSRRG
ncbi:hypothetical protein R1T16_07040 [Flavobacterium sp. DG1-102-2]|uniref:hypothetical protein n=1 Tax=Flavobacterium sp. DG1-102-2 TaxID=3081663 RepID=UPI0029490AEA|nr:hypothetical protein [Flavobacterium sp. DG1-102-2]MDV6168175.1 hypothetical protein [Flavobacterium sp. DG1-102-2]